MLKLLPIPKSPEPDLRIFSWSIFFTIILGLIDLWTGYEYSLSLFYLFPIAFASTRASFNVGAAIATLSAICWSSAEIYSDFQYSHWAVVVWNTLMRLSVFLLFSYLLSSYGNTIRHLDNISNIDSLTKLSNRRHFVEQAEKQLAYTKRHHDIASLVFIDLDNFKAINDALGHKTGDKVLITAARALSEHIRPYDLLARLGGDEFILLLPSTPPNEAKMAIEKSALNFEAQMQKDACDVHFSFGITAINSDTESIEEAINAADLAMYQHKKAKLTPTLNSTHKAPLLL